MLNKILLTSYLIPLNMDNKYTASNQFPKPIKAKKGQFNRPNKFVSLLFEVHGVVKETIVANTLWAFCNAERIRLNKTNKYKHGKLVIR